MDEFINKKNLNKRISEIYPEEKVSNEQTLREFLKESFEEYYGEELLDKTLDSMSDVGLKEFTEHLIYLWEK